MLHDDHLRVAPFDDGQRLVNCVLAGNQASHRHQAALAVGHVDGAYMQRLTHRSCRLVGTRGQDELMSLYTIRLLGEYASGGFSIKVQ